MMITYKDIKGAVNSTIKKGFNAPIQSRDVTEGFDRPSFFVELENALQSGYVEQKHKSLTIRVYYFPTDKYDYSIELLEVQDRLGDLFDLKLQVKDRFINIDEANAMVTDGVLNFSFDIEFYDVKDVPFGYALCFIDTNGEYLVGENGSLITKKIDIPDDVIVSGRDDINWSFLNSHRIITEEPVYYPVMVKAEYNGDPILDSKGNPVRIEEINDLTIGGVN